MSTESKFSSNPLAVSRKAAKLREASQYQYEFSDQTVSEAELYDLVFSKGPLKITVLECDTLIISNCIALFGIEIEGLVRNLVLDNVTGEITNSCISCQNIIVSGGGSKKKAPLKISSSKIEDLKRLELRTNAALIYSDVLHNLRADEIVIGKNAKLTLMSSHVISEKLNVGDGGIIAFSDQVDVKYDDLRSKLAQPLCKLLAAETVITTSSQLHFSGKGFEFNKASFSEYALDEADTGILSFTSKGRLQNIRVFLKR